MTHGQPPDPFRRTLLRAFAGALATPAWAAAGVGARDPVPLHAPQPIAQIHVTAADELLAISASGALWQHANGRWIQRAVRFDPRSPIASGHGRIAGRGGRGTLVVLADDRVSVASGPVLAPDAGLQILPFGIIGIAQQGAGRASVVRLDPGPGDVWSETARGSEPVLPDARPVQLNLDGPASADDGHIAVLAGPDERRYRHGVLGDATEATRVLYLERHSLAPLRSLALPPPHVFEDISPRPVAWNGGSALLTVRSGPRGAQLAIVAASRERPDALEIDALGAPIGTTGRWMAPVTDGRRLLAVHTPHIGGVLHEYEAGGGELRSRALVSGVCNHSLGQRELDLAAWIGPVLLVPTQDRRAIRVFDLAAGVSERPRLSLPSPVVATRALRLDRGVGCVLLLEDRSVVWATP
jgi:hypothetical protein